MLLACLGARAADTLDYIPRGDWSEGLKSAPVSGFDLALTSATARPVRPCSSKADVALALVIRTDLDGTIYPAVREDVPVYNYWLDQVKPSALSEGTAAKEKVLKWSTKTVLARLQQFEPANLVTIARVGSRAPSANDQVALGMICSDPGALPPLESYLFQFAVRSDASMSYRVVNAAGNTVWQDKQDHRVGLPFRVRWKPEGAQRGRYVLHLTAKLAPSAAVLDYKVTFDHLW